MHDPDLPPLELELDADLSSLAEVRRIASGFAHSMGFRERFDAEVVVTELVANAIVHTGSRPVVTLSRVGVRRMEIAVADGDPRSPAPVTPYEQGARGHGLAIVEHLSRAWGVRHDRGAGKTVWAEVEEDRSLTLVEGGAGDPEHRRPPERGGSLPLP